MITNEITCNNIRLLTISGGGKAENLLKELADYAMQEGYALEGYDKALIAREKEFPTGIQAKQGIAIPHADQEYTKKGIIMIARLEHKTEFLQMGTNLPVQVEMVFLLLVHNANHQVKVLENIVALIQNKEQMASLQSPSAITTLENVFKEYV